ncbi:aminotransferase class I/II-fold pyridoxal phosphate-dependent enzyme [Streptomyces nogalater]
MFDDLDVRALSRRPGAKWSRAQPGVLPAWIAEMDFPPAPAVREALLRCVEDDLGYPSWDGRAEENPLRTAFAERMRARHGWQPDPAHVREFTDINQGLQAVLNVATRPGTASWCTPRPTRRSWRPSRAWWRTHAVPYTPDGDGWTFDADRLDRELREGTSRVLLLVNPHNPTGRVLDPEELRALARLALRHDLLVVADEVHADLVHEPHRHIPFASLGDEVAARTVTLTSATKTFNVPGVRCAVAHVGAAGVREALARPTHLYGEPNTFGVAATLAAWEQGRPGWRSCGRSWPATPRWYAAGSRPGWATGCRRPRSSPGWTAANPGWNPTRSRSSGTRPGSCSTTAAPSDRAARASYASTSPPPGAFWRTSCAGSGSP